MEFIDFLGLDITNEYNNKEIMKVVFDLMNGLDTNGFSINPISIIPSINKFISVLKYNGLSEYENDLSSLAKDLSHEIGKLNSLRKSKSENAIAMKLNDCNMIYKDLFHLVTEAYINLGKGVEKEKSDDAFKAFSKLYQPEFSNKRTAIDLIEDALKLIESDNLLPVRAKKQIIKQLNKILSNLRRENTNWTNYFGAIKETVILLAALVTIGGSQYNLEHLTGAKDKLEEATKIIEITSINNNYIEYVNTENQVFQIQSDVKLLSNEKENNADALLTEHNKANAADAKSRTAD